MIDRKIFLILAVGWSLLTGCPACIDYEFNLIRCFELLSDSGTVIPVSMISFSTRYATLCLAADDIVNCLENVYDRCPQHIHLNPYAADELSTRVLIYGACRYKQDYNNGVECIGENFTVAEERAKQIFNQRFLSSYSRSTNVTEFCRKFSVKTRVLRNYIKTFNCSEAFTNYITQAITTVMPLKCNYKGENIWLEEFLVSSSMLWTSCSILELFIAMLTWIITP